ncbi:MAG TPA: hypothetical protein VFS62_05610 [Chloroflexota bacterium]|jgi:hypothetical protein|nr:hypothetical protein [Chloroflexota bacterium]
MKQLRRPTANHWEYQEFPLPKVNHESVFIGWLRDGWEFVGFHERLTTTREVSPVAIMRRERRELPLEARSL